MDSGGEAAVQRGVTYNYEALLDEHFQHLVQTLLLAEFPGLQCLPVGMPDGGRDAFTRGGIVAQVKFARNPSKIDDPFGWFKKAIAGEKAKLENLVQRGMQRYIFVCNIPGTSHLDAGLIDKANKYLDENLDVPSQCLWRDDLDRRLDRAYDVKLRFPHLLNGPDFLRLMWESPNNESLSRRRATIEAYLRTQYLTDDTLRFKQVEMLTTKLFDLYIDVPIRPVSSASERQMLTQKDGPRPLSVPEQIAAMVGGRATGGRTGHEVFDSTRATWAGAAELMSDQLQLEHVRRVVVEGAPGQGKTTLSQYLAQIQRARYLGKVDALEGLPAQHTIGPTFLPFKLELRDLSHWLTGLDPWDPDTSTRHNEIPSLESALAAHVRRYSGGSRFDVDDLRALLSETPALIMLDALDEVADLNDRKKVVAEIEAASERLDSPAGRNVVLVTSRPTAISNAPRIDRTLFVHYNLQPIEPRLALSYAKRWSAARGLTTRDSAELQTILQSKLDSTHMAELAKNTMQLTILLSLVLSRGSSLPDKRTELYSSYLDLFMSRESDKSLDVRDNRPLILDLHGYLAYQLHAKAEGQRTTGRISTDELREQVAEYLRNEGHSSDLASRLFDAVVQRVVAIVSRVEGTFEFEVQPLREYFAARHLYQTAPYSPTGKERKGTKPDRFDGIAPNPYWMNVTRFYGGFFSKGEILDLAHRVCDLIQCSDGAFDFYPRRLALALLQDWVFSQVPPAVKMVVEALLDDTGMVWASSLKADHRIESYLQTETDDFRLWPEGGGAEYARDLIWKRIISDSADDWCMIWCSLMLSVDNRDNIHARWTHHFHSLKSMKARTRWAQVAEFLQLIHRLSAVEYSDLLCIEAERSLGVRALALRGNEEHFRFLLAEHQHAFVKAVLGFGGVRPIEFSRDRNSSLNNLLILSHPYVWGRQFRMHLAGEISSMAKTSVEPFAAPISTLAGSLQGDIEHSLEPWERAIDSLEGIFGRTLTTIELSCTAAAIVSATERGQGASHLVNEESVSLPRRFRYARRQGNKSSWWKAQFERIASLDDAQVWLLGILTWASPSVVIDCLASINRAIGNLGEESRERLIGVLQVSGPRARRDPLPIHRVDELPEVPGLSYDTLLAVGARASDQLRAAVCQYLLPHLPRRRAAVYVFPFLMEQLFQADLDAEPIIDKLKDCTTGVLDSRQYAPAARHVMSKDSLLLDRIDAVIRHGADLPPVLVNYALTYRRLLVTASSTPVLRLARKEGWFEA
ncbi:probable large ATP-binding protein [Alloactinosynnema sp. L-07]|uniref:NACHT domain-containing protein n=1 Tax=Alloactinosynnema sp. L-07 TaxID=1653480 RepID=UPI00065F07C8|nr:hypothetical protein [Alloactinosynnema sp. L-07]CRK56766.1 probable large ATP-binding protein [Alloactinosynnema sp. L-07]